MENSKKPKTRPEEETFDDPSSEIDDAFDVLFGEEDEDIIELTDKVDSTPDHLDTGEETIMVMPDDLEMDDGADGDDIIELTDMVEASEISSAKMQKDDYEDIIDLIEKVSPVEHTAVGEDTLGTLADQLPRPSKPRAGTEPKSIIRLADVLEGTHSANNAPDNAIRMDVDDALLSEEMDDASDDAVDSLGIELDELDARVPLVTGDRIEAAVERYIMKRYGTAIEKLIAKAVEQKVINEIETLRRGRREDDSG